MHTALSVQSVRAAAAEEAKQYEQRESERERECMSVAVQVLWCVRERERDTVFVEYANTVRIHRYGASEAVFTSREKYTRYNSLNFS